MSAHLHTPQQDADEPHFERLTLSRLEALLEVEQSAYSHPWTRGNFIDAMASGYQIQVLLRGEELLGYFVAMQGVDEVAPWRRQRIPQRAVRGHQPFLFGGMDVQPRHVRRR